MRIAITGATGFVGSHLAESLVARGHQVTCLARDPGKLRWIANLPVRVVYGDVCSPETLPDLVRGQEAIIHAAGLTRAPDLDGFLKVNVGGTENMLDAVREHCPALRRFFFISSQEAMGPSTGGIPQGEDMDQNPLSMYGKSKSMAEQSLLRSSDTIPVTVVRPPTVYGPRDRDVFMYFRLAARGIAPIVGYSNMISIVYIKNLVEGIALALDRPQGRFRSYFFTDGPAVTWTAVSGFIAEALGKHPVQVNLPAFAVRMVGEISALYTGITHKGVLLSRDKVEAMKHEYWLISDERARTELGYRPAYSTEQGMRETAKWYREERWL